MTVLAAVALAALGLGIVLGDLRFLRVAQREHYLAGSALRFARRWWASRALNTAFLVLCAAGIAISFVSPAGGLLTAAGTIAGPLGLSLRGRTSRLVWTRRLFTTALCTLTAESGLVLAGAAVSGLAGAVAAGGFVAVLVPAVLDGVLLAASPLEGAVSRRFLVRASGRLARFAPLVVAVTGSYGKTTTKGYIAHLASAKLTVLASPYSYNNRLGLARTVNEHLGPATEVLVLEMGTYKRGEIAEMCTWFPPKIAVITAIGPAHLERFKTLDNTLAAKAEIAERAEIVVLNVDDDRLGCLAKSLESLGKKVVTASATSRAADVLVSACEEGIGLFCMGERVGSVVLKAEDKPGSLSNVACAVAVALNLGVVREEVLLRLGSLPVVANRLQRYEAGGGYVVLDDTFNSNPSGARLAIDRLVSEAPSGRRVVVTPGMVELGRTQRAENAALGEMAAGLVADLVVVGRTNKAALCKGAGQVRAGARVRLVGRLDEAASFVRGELGAGDAVLYENDLPDHFP